MVLTGESGYVITFGFTTGDDIVVKLFIHGFLPAHNKQKLMLGMANYDVGIIGSELNDPIVDLERPHKLRFHFGIVCSRYLINPGADCMNFFAARLFVGSNYVEIPALVIPAIFSASLSAALIVY